MAKASVVIKIKVTDLEAFRIAYVALCEINAYTGTNASAVELIASDAIARIQAIAPPLPPATHICNHCGDRIEYGAHAIGCPVPGASRG